jgi:hypothetical protein
MGAEYAVTPGEFSAKDTRPGAEITIPKEKILLMRFLCEGHYVPAAGKRFAYQELPWGQTYTVQFNGRCTLRAARTFSGDLAAFDNIFHAPWRVEPVYGRALDSSVSDKTGWRFEFVSGVYMSLLLWAGDEEFAGTAQFLFDDNWPSAFTAEDTANAGECAITRLKNLLGSAEKK